MEQMSERQARRDESGGYPEPPWPLAWRTRKRIARGGVCLSRFQDKAETPDCQPVVQIALGVSVADATMGSVNAHMEGLPDLGGRCAPWKGHGT